MYVKEDYDIVLVTWTDAEAHGEIGWNNIDEMKKYAKKPCPVIYSVGFVLFYDSDSHISLLSCISEDEAIGSSCEKIPVQFIKEIVYLNKEKGGKK